MMHPPGPSVTIPGQTRKDDALFTWSDAGSDGPRGVMDTRTDRADHRA